MSKNVYIIEFLVCAGDGESMYDYSTHFDEKGAMDQAEFFKQHPNRYRHINITRYVKSGEVEL